MVLADELKAYLLAKMPMCAPASGGTHVVFRCPHCGDSRDPRSKHFYVNLGYNETLPMFYCHLCHASGVITNHTLIHWGIYDMDLLTAVIKNNKYLYSLPKNRMLRHDKEVYDLSNTNFLDCELSVKKLEYINGRLGTNLNYLDLSRLKIVLNLFDLLEYNNVTDLSRASYLVEELDRSFIGFISQDNGFLNMRNLRKGKVPKPIDKRYINYNIFNKLDNTRRFYTIPTVVDLNNPNRLRINIAEGPFDILSVFINLMNQNYNHSINAAACGSGILNLIRFFICTLGLINIEFHIYRDNDMDDYILNNIAWVLKPFKVPFYVHSNTYPGEKDFGVPMDRIKEDIREIYY